MAGKVQPLDKQYKTQTQDQATTYDMSQYWRPSGLDGYRYNPDDLIGRQGLPIYSKMLNDEQVKAVCEFKLAAILARGWEFHYEEDCELSEEDKQTRVAVFMKMVRKMRGSFADALEAIATGREFGFSITEKIYGAFEYSGKTYVGINRLMTRDPCTFEFFTDEYGTLFKLKQRVSGKQPVEVDRDKVIHYVHRPKWDHIYGRSDLRAAYRSYYAKDQLVKLWLLFLEKFGGGIAIASKTDQAPASGTAAHTSLENALSRMTALRSIILPNGVTLEIVFPTSTDQYEKACQFHDLAIAKSLLVPNLLGLSHTGQTGAFSQSQTQLEAFFWTLNSDAQRLEECLNEELFRDIGDQNWSDGEYPRFCFKPASFEHIKWVVTTFKELMGAGALQATEDDEKFIRELLELPARTEESKPLIDPMEEREQERKETETNASIEQQKTAAANEERYAAVMKAIDSLRVQLSALPTQGNVTINNAAPSAEASAEDGADSNARERHATGDDGAAPFEPHGKLIGCTQAQFQLAAQRVAFSVIQFRTDNAAASAVNELATQVAKATRRALGTSTTMKELMDDDPSDIAAVEFAGADVGKLQAIYRRTLDEAWSIGSQHAYKELRIARKRQDNEDTRTVKLAALRDKAAEYFDSRAFRMAGDTADKTKQIIQQELQNGIKAGRSVDDTRASIWNRLVERGMTKKEIIRGVETEAGVNAALDALWADTVEGATAYLNTLVRTNTFEALNEARYAEFTDPELGDFVKAFTYAAVLDDSTSQICEYMDGRTYSRDSEVWDEWRPPNHFNCRSVLVPVTEIDGWDGEEDDTPAVEPQAGFK
jgi:SPP1 gp7 family putative phage head morphogenesis protein